MLAKQLSAAFKDILSSRQHAARHKIDWFSVTVQYCMYKLLSDLLSDQSSYSYIVTLVSY